jgi:sterol desaturase/sphingolipid hydroxylase (fatty acid hydroxylase superfamily)
MYGGRVIDAALDLLFSATHSLWTAAGMLLLSALIFACLALVLKGREAIAAARRAAAEVRINLWLYVIDVALVAPGLALLVQAVQEVVTRSGLALAGPETWATVGTGGTLLLAVFVGDLVSYWRHRFEHTRLLWPCHAVHHSDTKMTWLTLVRFHPINRATTLVIDIAGVSLLGFPPWALLGNLLIRHYYGEFIHADLPWTYGPLTRVFVSPVMHRWHHARDVVGSGSNFATVFSVFDLAWGTYYVPGPCDVPLGVNDDMGQGTIGQLLHPFVAWTGRLGDWWRWIRA